MAPKRKGGASKGAAAKAAPAVEEPVEEVVAHEASPPSEAPAQAAAEIENGEEEPSPKKVKAEEKKRGRKPKDAAKKPPAPKKKKRADDAEKLIAMEEEETVDEESPASVKSAKVIVIEASKECNSFKTRAAKVQTDLVKALSGVEVLVNPAKPRKGCFEIRDKEGNVYVSLLEMPRPYTKLKNLDLDKTVEDIVSKVK